VTQRKLAAGLALGGLLGLFAGARAALPPLPRAQSSRREAAADPARGGKLFRQNCAICHFSASTAKKIGPGLKGLAARGHYREGRKVDDASLRRWIEHGGRNMEGFSGRLKPDEVRDLIAYVKTL
jgi:mono/diheme cytochrome c family protein